MVWIRTLRTDAGMVESFAAEADLGYMDGKLAFNIEERRRRQTLYNEMYQKFAKVHQRLPLLGKI
jgi:hypothetical protein